MRNVYNLSIRAWLLSLLCLLVGGRAVANEPTDDHITVNEVTLVPGSTDTYQVEISLVGSQIYTAYQMDILFPPGVDVVVDEDGPYVDLWDGDGCIYPYVRRKLVHSLSSSYGVVSDKLLRISCSDDMNRVLTATSGKLLYFLVKVSPYLKPGDVVLKVTNLDFITITKENSQKYSCKDQTLTLHAKAESTATLSVSGSSHYGTCVLPFAVPTLPDGVKAYSAKGLDDTGQLVVLSEVKQLAAYTPYILYSTSGYSGSLSGTVDANKYGEVVIDGLLRGAIAPQKKSEGYVLQDLGEGAKFYAMDGMEFLIPEGKCWLEMPTAQASAPQYGIQIGATTGITAPTTAASAHGKIYTLDGKLVPTMQPGGIYVVNGKKVLKIK